MEENKEKNNNLNESQNTGSSSKRNKKTFTEKDQEKAREILKRELGFDKAKTIVPAKDFVEEKAPTEEEIIEGIKLEQKEEKKRLAKEKLLEEKRLEKENKLKQKEEARKLKQQQKEEKKKKKQQEKEERLKAKQEQKQPPQPEETESNEKDINKRLEENSKLSRVEDEEIARMKREIAIERGLISPDDAAEYDEHKAEEEKKSKEKKKEEKEEEKKEQQQPEQTEQAPAAEANPEDLKSDKHKNIFDHVHGYLAPAVSLPDDITDEDIQQVLEEQEKQAILAEEEEEEESYEGMTEEEIADAKERKRKFNELKMRYNSKDLKADGEIGDYRKNLDFTINTSIKRFRVKPPKKPFIISAIVLFLAIITSGIITYFVLNRPPAPVVLTKVELSTDATSQVVGQKIDLRGIYVTETYSDGTKRQVFLTTDMITDKTSNITAEYVINSYRQDTRITFTFEGKQIDLVIKLTQSRIRDIKLEIFGNVVKGQELKFENILMLGTVEYFVQNNVMTNTDTKKLSDYENLKLATEAGVELQRTETGFVIPDSLEGQVTLKATYFDQANNRNVTTDITITL